MQKRVFLIDGEGLWAGADPLLLQISSKT